MKKKRNVSFHGKDIWHFVMNNLLSLFVVASLLSCGDNQKHTASSTNLKTSVEKSDSIQKKQCGKMCILFLGHIIDMRKDLSNEFARICAEDKNLSFDNVHNNITIYGTTFHLNYNEHRHGFVLMSSFQPDTRQIKTVRDAISKYHGEENIEEPNHYSWFSTEDSKKIGMTSLIIHLKRVRSSEGGTMITVS